MKSTNLLKSLAVIATLSGTPHSAVQGQTGKVQFANIENVKVNDAFWSPKFKTWNEVTINDVLNKFEGKHTNAPEQHNAFCNFDKVAKGERGTQGHFGEPWFDGLIYESIRGIADYLVMYPDKELETRIDRYIDRIEAAQMTEPTGYLETYTLLKLSHSAKAESLIHFTPSCIFTDSRFLQLKKVPFPIVSILEGISTCIRSLQCENM